MQRKSGTWSVGQWQKSLESRTADKGLVCSLGLHSLLATVPLVELSPGEKTSLRSNVEIQIHCFTHTGDITGAIQMKQKKEQKQKASQKVKVSANGEVRRQNDQRPWGKESLKTEFNALFYIPWDICLLWE